MPLSKFGGMKQLFSATIGFVLGLSVSAWGNEAHFHPSGFVDQVVAYLVVTHLPQLECTFYGQYGDKRNSGIFRGRTHCHYGRHRDRVTNDYD